MFLEYTMFFKFAIPSKYTRTYTAMETLPLSSISVQLLKSVR